jgi:hypothetical protein
MKLDRDFLKRIASAETRLTQRKDGSFLAPVDEIRVQGDRLELFYEGKRIAECDLTESRFGNPLVISLAVVCT